MKDNDGDFEFLLVSDHQNEDNGEDIARAYATADSRFRALHNEHSKGVSGARNTGLDHMRGEWFTFIDCDDAMNENAYETMIKATGVSADIHQFNHLRYYEKRDRLAMKYEATEGWYDIQHLPPVWCMVWNKLYRTSIYGKVRFVEGLQYGEDEIFNLECFDISDRIYCNRTPTVIHMFTNKGSLSKTKRAEGLIAQARALEDAIYRLKNPLSRQATLETLAEHWSSPTYHTEFVDKLFD